MKTISIISSLLSFVTLASAETVELRGGKQIEFTDLLDVGQTWGTQFQLVEGTIGFKLTSPEGVIFEGPAETYGSYSLTAKSHGLHSFKFMNTDGYGNPPKKITFSVTGSHAETAKDLNPVHNELRQLNMALRTVQDEHAFLMDRELKHRDVAKSTNRKVFIWFMVQLILLSAVCYFQIRSLKSYFEVRRVV